MNPLLNEAVVCAAVERMKGTVTLIEASSDKLDISRGLESWLVPDPSALRGISLFRYLSHLGLMYLRSTEVVAF